ncbi:hypothetical protein PQR41_43130 [Paraburkholderia xenovorans]|uniref:hypothetical protein n=1 Tax=Paraburkholderia xenovorans TaxID=36873 RepID=UPI0038B7319F
MWDYFNTGVKLLIHVAGNLEFEMSSKRKLVAASAVSLAVIIGVSAVYQTFGGESVTASAAAAAPSAAEVDVAAVISRSIIDFQTYSGRIEAINFVEIRPLVSGTIVAVHSGTERRSKGRPAHSFRASLPRQGVFSLDPRRASETRFLRGRFRHE